MTPERALARALGDEAPDTKYATEDLTLVEVVANLKDAGWPITRAVVARLGRAAYDWWRTTHADMAGHDHHCPATIWHHGQQVPTQHDCTCGWGEFEAALGAMQRWKEHGHE